MKAGAGRASATPTWTARPQRRQRSRQQATRHSSHGTNGSQIRSTSALLIRDRSASTHRRRGGPDEQQHRPVGIAAPRGEAAAPARPQHGPGADGRERRGCPTASTTPAGSRRCRPSTLVEHRVGLPPDEARRGERQHDRRAPPARQPAAAATTAPAASTASASSAEQGQAVGQHAAPQPSSSPASADHANGAAAVAARADRQGGEAPGGHRGEHARRPRPPSRPRRARGPGTAQPGAQRLGAERAQRHQHRDAVVAATRSRPARRRSRRPARAGPAPRRTAARPAGGRRRGSPSCRRPSSGIRSTNSCSIAGTSCGAGGPEVLVAGCRDPRDPVGAVDEGQRQQPRQPADVDATSSRRHGSGRPSRRRTASRAAR